MIEHYLDRAINNIQSLIEMTNEDIADIKQARNDAIFERTKLKDEVITLFENNKALLDNELIKLVQKNPNKELPDLLSKEETKKLQIFKENLKKLQEKNREYARLVVAVNEFYTSLFDKIFPTEMENYKKINPKSFSLLKVKA